ncbi:MAG: hypothetical protein OEO23_15000 [Gemmatimonadota bacterium]|nr:hypothetical protein [Gemmatimonadota bacterium]
MIDPSDDNQAPQSDYVKRNRIAIGVIAVFAVIGALLGSLVAPGIPSWRSTLAGAMLGAFSGGAAVLNRLLD